MNTDHVFEKKFLEVTKTLEKQVDAAIDHIDNLDINDLEQLRKQRLQELKQQQSKKQQWLQVGHGSYEELAEEKMFFDMVKKSENVIVHFFTPTNTRSPIVDKHLKILAPKHLETRIVSLNAEKCPFLSEKLRIKVIPALVCIHNGIVVDKIVGFSSLGNTDDFPTAVLEWRLAQSKVIDYEGDISVMPTCVEKKEKVIRRGIRDGAFSNQSDDDLEIEDFSDQFKSNDKAINILQSGYEKYKQNYLTPEEEKELEIHCCDKSNKSKCREACKNALLTIGTHQEAIDMIEAGGCGLPLPQDQFWQCFFKSDDSVTTSMEVSRIEKVGMDSAKWHCCQKANSAHCKRLCSKTFRKDWSTSWEQFHLKCLSQASEEGLRNCIDEVEEPCELGCDGLSFCTNFNNRPTELFRSCTPRADEAARNDVAAWKTQNGLNLPGFNLPLKNISECSMNTWKAIACTLHIKPCSRQSHGNQICRDICLDIISMCVNWPTVPSIDLTPESICNTLSPEKSDVSCVSLQNYLHPAHNPYQPTSGQVSSPCKGEPCEPDQICIVNRNCALGNACVPYKCVRGCKLGEVSEYVVPDGAYVRIPMPNNPKGCLQICKCSNGLIEDCQPLPCVPLNPCVIGNNEYKEHGTVYNKECNTCSCFAEENICTKKLCKNHVENGKDSMFTSMPCNYPPHYIPVCGRNGNTYPSSSLAKCAGLNDSDIEYGACPDPCKSNPCLIGQKCVPDTKVCLSLNQKPCLQYQCINGTINCHELPKDPVCDMENKEYKNACFLAHHNSKFAYKGPCLHNCKHTGRVCGINGKSYVSECAAWADLVSVDYAGPCVAVGLISNTNAKQCAGVKCLQLPDPKCVGVTPPGACCPLCGGAVKFLFSSKQIDRALYALQNKSTNSVSLNSLLKALERHVQVAQCGVKGFLSVEGDIFVIVQSTEKHPSQLQLEACVREAEKLVNLVNKQSPRIISELSLSC
ncbi:hypothetical protein FQR65_LT14931 [Abscondita terminalis]|nr:hypothetical protein FQR65_LT14931 [Abscondita terminalis]